MKLVWLLCATLALGLGGCAKFPDNPIGAGGKRLVFKLTVQGKLRTGQGAGQTGLPYVYIIALNLSNDDNPTTQGPIPIVVPGGNGMVAGDATHFILWDPLASPQYKIFKFRDSTLAEWFQIGIPVNYVPTAEGDRTMQFEIDLSQLVPVLDVPNLKSVQVNYLTMNNTNTSGSGRIWDALGDANIPTQVNAPFTFRLNASRVFNNLNQGNIEPVGDSLDPDLDLSDWEVEVRIQ
ncbi:hypothetical protein QPK87_09670 [Kamptonema cortianum]|nr:hypothetical protein [Geitlerinema splendidum]MDK3156842.1 hypothetical protein [Kamptonema cortianum]